tara:strand:- start:1437 stop:2435 length:999 start_codon:yes stop_codon:yes gene_type:complete
MAFTITGTGITFPDGTKFATSPTRGVHAGIRYVFSTSTDVSSTPGDGNIRFNNSTFSSITEITVAGTNADEQDFEAFLDDIVDISAPEDNMRGYLFLVSNDDTANSSFNEAIFRVDTANTAKRSGYVDLGVSPLAGSIFSNSESISLMFFPRGDRGDTSAAGPEGGVGPNGPAGPQGGGGGGSPSECLLYGMQVLLHNNTLINVEDLREGNYIATTNHTNVYTRIEGIIKNHIREGHYIINNELKITNDHPVMTDSGKKKVEELRIGDYIGNNKVTTIEYVEGHIETVSIKTSADDFNVYVNENIYSVDGRYSQLIKEEYDIYYHDKIYDWG